MDRRKFLITTGSGTLAATAGCLGYNIETPEEREEQKNRVDQLETEIKELEEELNSAQNRNSELEQERNSAQDRNSELESDITEAKYKQILWLYSYGITHYNNGIDKYNSGYDLFVNENYVGARAEFNVAAGYFDSASVNFNAATNRADDMSESTVERYCSDAVSKSDYMSQAVGDYQTGAEYYRRGDSSTGSNYINDGDGHYSQAQNTELRDLGELESELDVTIDT